MDSRIVRFLDDYVGLSKHLSVEYVNPTVYPSVLTKYGCDANTVVVTCASTGRQETVAIDSIIGYDEMSYYYYGTKNETDFDAEGLITSAVDGVLTSASRTVYQTSGHGETAIPDSVTALFKKDHMPGSPWPTPATPSRPSSWAACSSGFTGQTPPGGSRPASVWVCPSPPPSQRNTTAP